MAAKFFTGLPLDGPGRQACERLLERVGLALPASTAVAKLTPGQMQLCEIAKALGQSARFAEGAHVARLDGPDAFQRWTWLESWV